MTKQLQLFLNSEDEKCFTTALRKSVSGISFLNDNVWLNVPDTRGGIEDCASGRVYLFSRPLCCLPTARRKTGELEGPISGCVIQILRSLLKDGVLLSGRVAVGFNAADNEMKLFVSKVWQCVSRLGERGVLRPDGGIDKNYLVGHHLIKQVREGTLHIADRATGIPYELVT